MSVSQETRSEIPIAITLHLKWVQPIVDEFQQDEHTLDVNVRVGTTGSSALLAADCAMC